VKQIHISGGVQIPGPGNTTRLLDDHAHDVAAPCYEMLEKIAATVDHSLNVVIERDGGFPPFEQILEQVRRTKMALRAGRSRKVVHINGSNVIQALN
jgi:uncharacterized protein (UPF0276 family)